MNVWYFITGFVLILKYIVIVFWGHSNPLKLTKMSKKTRNTWHFIGVTGFRTRLLFDITGSRTRLSFGVIGSRSKTSLPNGVIGSKKRLSFGVTGSKFRTELSNGVTGSRTRLERQVLEPVTPNERQVLEPLTPIECRIVRGFLTFWLIWGA